MAKILLLDDEQVLKNLFAFYLKHYGHEVITSSVDNIAQFSAENEIDVLITDIIMPERSGWDIIREVRDNSPNIGIVAISGGMRNDPTPYLRRASEVGADATLSKPFELEQLRETIETVISKHQSDAE